METITSNAQVARDQIDRRIKSQSLVGQKINDLLVIAVSDKRKNGRSAVICRCDCGNEKKIEAYQLLRENMKPMSCGCKKNDRGLPKTYYSWKSMRERCTMDTHHAYKNYGGRGIRVCEAWQGPTGYENFLKDMGERPEGRTLDRIDNDGNYTAKNCKWSTPTEKSNNKRNSSAKHIRRLLESLDLDLTDENLIETPLRVAKSLREDLLKGYRQHPSDVLTTSFASEAKEMVILKDIELYSTCSHHLLPFVGKAHVAYIPNGKVVGLSKLARIVEVFSRRLQLQENLTSQIADSLMKYVEPIGVGVIIEAKHFCMCARGVQKQNSVMMTSALRGVFKDDHKVRDEFLRLGGSR